MHLIDHEDLETPHHRLIDRLLKQLRDLINAPVGSGIEFCVVHKPAAIDVRARLANAARCCGDTPLSVGADTVQGFGQDAGDGRLANTPCTGEQVGMMQPLRRQSIAERLHHMRLPHHFREIFGTVFASENEIRHGFILKWDETVTRHGLPSLCPYTAPENMTLAPSHLQSVLTSLPAW